MVHWYIIINSTPDFFGGDLSSFSTNQTIFLLQDLFQDTTFHLAELCFEAHTHLETKAESEQGHC